MRAQARDKAYFWPEFIAKLPDGRILVVEYKCEHLWKQSEGDRKIGALWEEMSGGKCLFVMVTTKTLGMIDGKVG